MAEKHSRTDLTALKAQLDAAIERLRETIQHTESILLHLPVLRPAGWRKYERE